MYEPVAKQILSKSHLTFLFQFIMGNILYYKLFYKYQVYCRVYSIVTLCHYLGPSDSIVHADLTWKGCSSSSFV